ncbi:MAG: PEGA domain-containing protein [Myxococcales bacterium]|nr:PEGA domain-containing protein [Myxococcales bacterium]
MVSRKSGEDQPEGVLTGDGRRTVTPISRKHAKDELGHGSWGDALEFPRDDSSLFLSPKSGRNIEQVHNTTLSSRSRVGSAPLLKLPSITSTAPRANRSRPNDGQAISMTLPMELFTPEDSDRGWVLLSARRRLAVILGGVCVLGMGMLFFLMQPSLVSTPGLISIMSEPSGGIISINGEDIDLITPSPLMEYEPGTILTVSVRRNGYITEPVDRTIEIQTAQAETIFFSLTPVRTIRVMTEPRGARVRINGQSVAGKTPIDVPQLMVGARVHIQVELDNHIAAERVVEIGEEWLQVLEPISLQPAVHLNVETVPDSASAFLGERYVGQTPLYDVKMPQGDRARLRLEKPGYRSIVRRLRFSRNLHLRFDFKEQRLSDLKLSKTERAEARRLERRYVTAKRAAAQARTRLVEVETELEESLKDRNVLFGARARAEAAVDRATHQLAEAEQLLIDTEAQVEAFRAALDHSR